MPWWVWLLVDLLILAAATVVLVWTGWRFFRRTKAFFAVLGGVRAQLPQVERPHGDGGRA